MKKQLATLAVCFLTFGSFAKIRIVDNNVNNPGNYSSLQKAIDESVDGDTVYIKFSTIGYDAVELSKRLVMIGERNLDKNIDNVSKVKIIDIKSTNANGSVFIGFYTSFNISANNINNILFQRMYIEHFGSSISSLNNLIFINCFIRNCNNDIGINHTFYNCIGKFPLLHSIARNCVLQHTYRFVNSQISNSILIGYSLNYSSYCSFSNNISLYPSSNTIENSSTDNGKGLVNGVGNNGSNLNLIFSVPFYYTDFHIQADGNGKNFGTDGTDVGIYGGLYPWPEEMTGFFPSENTPKIIDMEIKNTITNKTIDVNLKAKSVK